MIRVVGMATQSATELFPVAALRVDMPAHRTCLTGIIRLYFQERHAMPVQFGHQLFLQAPSSKNRKLTIQFTALAKFPDVKPFQHRQRSRPVFSMYCRTSADTSCM